MGEASQFKHKLDRRSYGIALRTFSFMHDHFGQPGIIDPAAVFITQQDIAEIIKKLKANIQGMATAKPSMVAFIAVEIPAARAAARS